MNGGTCRRDWKTEGAGGGTGVSSGDEGDVNISTPSPWLRRCLSVSKARGRAIGGVAVEAGRMGADGDWG